MIVKGAASDGEAPLHGSHGHAPVPGDEEPEGSPRLSAASTAPAAASSATTPATADAAEGEAGMSEDEEDSASDAPSASGAAPGVASSSTSSSTPRDRSSPVPDTSAPSSGHEAQGPAPAAAAASDATGHNGTLGSDSGTEDEEDARTLEVQDENEDEGEGLAGTADDEGATWGSPDCAEIEGAVQQAVQQLRLGQHSAAAAAAATPSSSLPAGDAAPDVVAATPPSLAKIPSPVGEPSAADDGSSSSDLRTTRRADEPDAAAAPTSSSPSSPSAGPTPPPPACEPSSSSALTPPPPPPAAAPLFRADSSASSVGGDDWHAHDTHFFLLSTSGKPIFSHHGSEAALANLAALITALLSVVVDFGDKLHSVQSGGTLVVFLNKGPLHLVATTTCDVPLRALQKQLELLYCQVVFIVTAGLERMIQRNPAYDVRNMLDGTSGVLNALIRGMQQHPAHMFAATQPLAMPAPDRAVASFMLGNALKSTDAFYGVLMVGDVAIAVERNHKLSSSLHPLDLLLLANFVTCNPAFRYGQSESFCPVCLPHYDPMAFLHAYISFLDVPTGVYVVLLSGSSEHFYLLREARTVLQQHLQGSGALTRLHNSLGRRPEGRLRVEDLPRPLGAPFGETPLWHFVFKLPARNQVVIAGWAAPFNTPKARAEATRAYAHLNSLVFDVPEGGKANKVVWLASDARVMLACVDREVEVMLILDPLTDKATGLAIMEALRKHFMADVQKAETFM